MVAQFLIDHRKVLWLKAPAHGPQHLLGMLDRCASGYRDRAFAHEVVESDLRGGLSLVSDGADELEQLQAGRLVLRKPLRAPANPPVKRRVCHDGDAFPLAQVEQPLLRRPVEDAVPHLVARDRHPVLRGDLEGLLQLRLAEVAHSDRFDSRAPAASPRRGPTRHKALVEVLDRVLDLPQVDLLGRQALHAGPQRREHGGPPGADGAADKGVGPGQGAVLGPDDDLGTGRVAPQSLLPAKNLFRLLAFLKGLVTVNLVGVEEVAT
eukprot:CAMPEP_0177583472 /NCGR_PEP_ID=MMETSP0419_2-20121207/3341_1 /TAXON_ID=582737 /ORGANISM="Tetraselmis sp., Strain GSL018" /LENGTH=264 /DNA_ID=CAMNT_0019072867 /DNA_START=174 /DNA_END=968 /DNA_ORIENTATION=+